MTREEKIKAIEKYCNSFEDCDKGCKIFEIYDMCSPADFKCYSDKYLDDCMNLIKQEEIKQSYSLCGDQYSLFDDAGTTIKDSGNRREFESGAVRDMQEGKGRMDLLPWAAIIEVSKHCEAGAKKYGEHNVDKGIPTNSLCDSAARHLAKYLDGWTDENHLVAAAWNLLWCIEMTIKKPEMVNTPFEIKDSKK